MAEGKNLAPLIGTYFAVEFQGQIAGAFQEASGFGSENQVIEYRATDAQGRAVLIKEPGPMKFNDIVLKRGITDNRDFWGWRKLVEQGKMEQARKDGSIVMYTLEGEEVARFNFRRAWCFKITGGNTDAKSNNILIEELHITSEGYERVK